MQLVNGIQVLNTDPSSIYQGLDKEPTWFSAQGGVYQCYDLTTQQPVAIKKYLVENTQQSDAFVMPQELVENEIYTMTKCNHNNIVKLLSVHLHKEFVYLIMPLCAGGSLQQHVFTHHLNFGQLAYIIASIASGLQEIHSHGYIHRDIKCDNIFLDSQTNQIVIGDFGVVSITPSADSSVEEAGVVLFWAPELVQGKIINCKVDIWALGIVILEIINGGRAPYEDDKLDEVEIKRRILIEGNPAYPIGLPSRLYDLLDKCLNPDPRARASASDILKHPFILESKHQSLFTTTVDNQSSETCMKSAVVNEDSTPDDPQIQQVTKSIHEMDTTSDQQTTQPNNPITSTASLLPPTSPTRRVLPRKCRLPIPSYTLKDLTLTPIPSKDKIANVQFNRRSLNITYRKQGSRLPMVILPKSNASSPASGKKIKKTRSIRLSASTLTAYDYSKSDTTMKNRPADLSQQKKRQQQRLSSLSCPKNTGKKRYQQSSTSSSPMKPAISSKSVTPTATQPLSHRQKRLPETRSGLLMMGISTTGNDRGKSTTTTTTSTVSPSVAQETMNTTTTLISATRLSSSLTAPLSGKKRHPEAQHKKQFSPTSSLSTGFTAPSHKRISSLSPPLASLPETQSPQQHQQSQRQRVKQANGDKPQRTSLSTSPAKERNRYSSLATKKGSSSPSSLTTANGSIGKNDSLKGVKVLQAY